MMIKIKRITSVLALLLFVGAGNLAALEVPTLKGHVNDYAGMLSASSRRQLETVLTTFEQQESTQIVLLTVPSLEGDALENFSIRVAETWKIGQSGSDNGAILLISKKDRKIRIEVGYGLEGSLTDLKAGRIIRNVIAPRFKMGQFDQGILEGISAMMGTVKGEYEATDTAKKSSGKGQGIPFMVIALFFLLNGLGRANRGMGAVVGGILFPIAGLLFFGLGPADAAGSDTGRPVCRFLSKPFRRSDLFFLGTPNPPRRLLGRRRIWWRGFRRWRRFFRRRRRIWRRGALQVVGKDLIAFKTTRK